MSTFRIICFGDDLILISPEENHLENMLTELDKTSHKIGISINTNKTKIKSKSEKEFRVNI